MNKNRDKERQLKKGKYKKTESAISAEKYKRTMLDWIMVGLILSVFVIFFIGLAVWK